MIALIITLISLPVILIIMLCMSTKDEDEKSYKPKYYREHNFGISISQDQHIDNYNYIVKMFGSVYSNNDEEVRASHRIYRGKPEWEYHTVYKLSHYGSIYFPRDFPRYLISTEVNNTSRYQCENAKKYMQEFNDVVLTIKKHADIITACKKYGFFLDIERLLKSDY